MGRFIGVLGLMLLSPACSKEFVEEADLTVVNEGVEEVRVNSYSYDWRNEVNHERHFSVAPGDSRTVRFSDVFSLAVTVRRSSDLSEIFHAEWTADELKDLHRKVTVTVSP